MSYITHRSSGYGYGCCTELTAVSGTGITRANTPGMVLYVPYTTQPCLIQLYCCTRFRCFCRCALLRCTLVSIVPKYVSSRFLFYSTIPVYLNPLSFLRAQNMQKLRCNLMVFQCISFWCTLLPCTYFVVRVPYL